MIGYRNKVASLKLDGTMSTREGKQQLSFTAYQSLAKIFLKLRPTTTHTGNHRGEGTATTFQMGIFAWVFLLF